MVTTIEHDDVTTIEDGAYTYQESDESKAFRDFKGSFDDEKMGSLRVHRVPESKTVANKAKLKTIFLFACTIDQFDFDSLLEYLRDNYGGGTFRLIGSRAGHGGVAFNRLVEIEAPINHGYMGSLNGADPLRKSGDPTDIIDRMGAVLLEQSARQEEMFARLMGPQTGGDHFSQMTAMAKSFAEIMGAMGIQPPQPVQQQSIGSQIKDFLLVKDLLEGMGSGNSGGGDANFYTVLTETIKHFGGPIAAAIAAGQEAGTVSDTGVLEHSPADLETDEEREQRQYIEGMRTQVRILVKNAEQNVDPAQFANLLVANTPEPMLDKLYEFLNAENYIDQLISLDPGVENHKNWFIKLRDTVLELLTAPPDDDTIPPTDEGQDLEAVAGTKEAEKSDQSNSDTGEDS